MMVSAAFNLLMLLADLAALAFVRRRPDATALIAAVSALGAIAMLCGFVLGEGFFGVLRLWAYAVFVHLPLVAFGIAVVAPKVTWRVSALAAALIVIAIGVDAFLIEPQQLELTRYELRSKKLDRALRIVVIADLQTDRVGDYERRALERAMAEKPDLVLLPGDYIQGPTSEWPRLAALLAEVGVKAPLGVHAVQGNVDAHGWTAVFGQIDAELYELTRTSERPGIAITGLTLADSFDPDLSIAARDRFHVVFGHAPDFARGEVSADLLVAGHTHGGQVRLPWLGPIVTLSSVPRAWAAGKTDLPGGRTLVVSRGVGMERGYAPRLRFLCRPELVVIDVLPAS